MECSVLARSQEWGCDPWKSIDLREVAMLSEEPHFWNSTSRSVAPTTRDEISTDYNAFFTSVPVPLSLAASAALHCSTSLSSTSYAHTSSAVSQTADTLTASGEYFRDASSLLLGSIDKYSEDNVSGKSNLPNKNNDFHSANTQHKPVAVHTAVQTNTNNSSPHSTSNSVHTQSQLSASPFYVTGTTSVISGQTAVSGFGSNPGTHTGLFPAAPMYYVQQMPPAQPPQLHQQQQQQPVSWTFVPWAPYVSVGVQASQVAIGYGHQCPSGLSGSGGSGGGGDGGGMNAVHILSQLQQKHTAADPSHHTTKKTEARPPPKKPAQPQPQSSVPTTAPTSTGAATVSEATPHSPSPTAPKEEFSAQSFVERYPPLPEKPRLPKRQPYHTDEHYAVLMENHRRALAHRHSRSRAVSRALRRLPPAQREEARALRECCRQRLLEAQKAAEMRQWSETGRGEGQTHSSHSSERDEADDAAHNLS